MHILARSKSLLERNTYDAIMLHVVHPIPSGVHHKSTHQASILQTDTNVPKLQLSHVGHKWRIERSLAQPPVAYRQSIAIRKAQQFALHAM